MRKIMRPAVARGQRLMITFCMQDLAPVGAAMWPLPGKINIARYDVNHYGSCCVSLSNELRSAGRLSRWRVWIKVTVTGGDSSMRKVHLVTVHCPTCGDFLPHNGARDRKVRARTWLSRHGSGRRCDGT